MLALLAALLPLIQGAGTGAIAAALSQITVLQWIEIGLAVAKAGPEIVALFQKLHPALDVFIQDVIQNEKNITLAAHGVHSELQAWMKTNGDEVIRMYPGNVN